MDNIILTSLYRSPCGDLILGSFGDRLCLCNWAAELHPGRIFRRLHVRLGATFEEAPTPVTRAATIQLDEYFARRRKVFDVPLLFAGTEFQERVWHTLAGIPYGSTLSSAALAARMGMPRAVRAVAGANGANALSLFVPCHRVIGADGSITGYGGGAYAKSFLLELERE